MNNQIKVIQIVPWYPNMNDKHNPSRGSFFQEQFTSLSKFVDLTVIVIDMNYISTSKNFKDYWNIENKEVKTFDLYRVKAMNIPRCFKCTAKYISWLLSKSHISEAIKNCDLIHSHVIFPSGAIGYELSRIFKKPFILTEHASYLDRLLKNSYLNDVLINSDYVTAVSNFLKNKILNYDRKQCEVIPNYINTEKYYFKKNISQLNKILHISSMADIKNVDKLLFGVKNLLEEDKVNIEMVMIGGGINIDKYQEMTANLGLTEVVKFIGDVSNKTLREYLSSSDALIITSTTETFSVVGIEALASGIPIITTKCGGPEDYIIKSTGLFIDTISPIAISNGLRTFLKTKNQFDAELIQEYCYQNFDAVHVVKKIVNIYCTLLGKLGTKN